MSKNKSINELLNSIVSLINEAKNEYEFVINKDLPKNIYPEIEKIQTKDTIKVDKNSNTNSQLQISSSEEKQLKSSHSWQNINFKKTTKKSNLKSFSNNLSNPKNETENQPLQVLSAVSISAAEASNSNLPVGTAFAMNVAQMGYTLP